MDPGTTRATPLSRVRKGDDADAWSELEQTLRNRQ